MKSRKKLTYDQINAISMSRILDAVGIKYEKQGDNLCLYSGGELSGGWKGHISRGFIKDFSGKGRAEGGPFGFIKKHLNLSSRETFIWYRDNF